MKKKVIAFCLLLISIVINGQTAYTRGDAKYIKEIKGQTILVVLSGEEEFRKALKKTFELNWTFSKYDFITEEQLKKQFKDKDKVFLFGYYKVEIDWDKHDLYGVPIIGISDKYKADGVYPIRRDINIFYPYPTAGFEPEALEAYLALNIRIIDRYLTIFDTKSSLNHSWNFRDYGHYIGSKNVECKSRKILICKNDIYIEKEDITKRYNFDCEIVKTNRIIEAINNREDVLIFYMVPSLFYCYYCLVSAKDGEIFYFLDMFDGDFYYKSTQKMIFKKLSKAK